MARRQVAPATRRLCMPSPALRSSLRCIRLSVLLTSDHQAILYAVSDAPWPPRRDLFYTGSSARKGDLKLGSCVGGCE